MAKDDEKEPKRDDKEEQAMLRAESYETSLRKEPEMDLPPGRSKTSPVGTADDPTGHNAEATRQQAEQAEHAKKASGG